MLAKLDEQAQDYIQEDVVEEVVLVDEELIEEPVQQESIEEVVVDESKEEVVEDTEEQLEESVEDAEDDIDLEKLEALAIPHETVVVNADDVDLKARLDTIVENKSKLEKDLSKIQKSILKYERTKRRKNRNQKMLDRRASELTNLNLVMYSVTDIKNVDEDKKIKQEELTAHIAELKASIQDAEEFIESNKEKNEHEVKMAKFLINECSRYAEEIAELNALINKKNADNK